MRKPTPAWPLATALFSVSCATARVSGSGADATRAEARGEADDVVADGGMSTANPAPVEPAEPIAYDGLNGIAKNPIISHVFTADPSARVFEGRVYVYASHDLDTQDGYDMTDYHVFSSSDLVNWQDHGVALDARDITWASKLYAPDCAYDPNTDKYFLYFPDSGSGIGVAVSDDPGGPFVDAIGEPLVTHSTPGVEDVEWVFDPSAFIDDDGQAYLYFGGGLHNSGDNARVIRLNPDMVSLADAEATTIPAPDFFEAAFVHKREGKYYLSYSTTFADHAAHIDYMISDDPMTGFEYAGTVLENPAGNNHNNNHHSIVEFEGQWYVFFHNRMLSNRDRLSEYQRSISLSPMTYDAEGFIEKVPTQGSPVMQLTPLDAFSRLDAETMADQRGVEVDFVERDGERGGVCVTDLNDGDWIGYSQVDFGDGANLFHARVASAAAEPGRIDVYVDGCDRFSNLPGTLIGSCDVPSTSDWQDWTDVSCDIESTEDVHDVYLRFVTEGSDSGFNFDWFQFE